MQTGEVKSNSAPWRAAEQALRAVDDAYVSRAHLRAADPVICRYRRLLRAAA